MGQKVNPIIFRVNNLSKNNWKSNYLSKKSTEISVTAFNDLELRSFIIKFVELHNLTVHDLKLYYSNNELKIFISYFLNEIPEFLPSQTHILKQFPTKLLPITKVSLFTVKKLLILKNFFNEKRNHSQFVRFQDQQFKKIFSKTFYKSIFLNRKLNIILINRIQNKNYQNLKKKLNLNNLKFKKNLLDLKNFQSQQNQLFIKLFETLSLFTKNKKNISLTLKLLQKPKIFVTKKILLQFRMYEQQNFFKNGLKVLMLSLDNPNSAKILSSYIAFYLKKQKKHNFFLNFLKQTLVFLIEFSKIRGVKIKIKGRFNGAPRSKHRILQVGDGIPLNTLQSNINYAETTSFTRNGTFGIKVWIYEKIFRKI